MSHKDAAGAHHAHVSPGSAPMELAVQSMELVLSDSIDSWDYRDRNVVSR